VDDDVLADQRPVEVAGEGGRAGREPGRKAQPPCVDWYTKAATSAICCSLSEPPFAFENGGIAPLPLWTRSRIFASGGFASSRFGPTVPCELAALSVWQAVQPAVRKTCLPRVGSPFGPAGTVSVGVVGFGTLPSTVFGVGVVDCEL
jgi:hypothetical protein